MQTTRSTTVRRSSLAPLAAFAAGLAFQGVANANILNNPGFETATTTTVSNVLGNFTGFQGIWAPEMGSITTATLGVTPAAGARMLGMTNDGLTATQSFQAVDVTAYSALINSGTATMNASALFNTNGGYTGAQGSIVVQFFTAASYGSLIGNSGFGSLALDANPLSWETNSVSSAIPVGTTWMLFQVAYGNASIGNNTGFVDNAFLEIVPSPGAIALLGLGGLVGRRRR
ncbi:MAG: hypothetical protein GC172_11980 [Phycisphaera sp.]|nr:hypothetical protein [Phycisphaera sp.]